MASNPLAAGGCRPRSAALPDGAGDHVLGIRFDGRGEFERVLLVDALGLDGHEALLALRERPRLVEDDRVEVAGLLHRDAVPDEHPVARGQRRVDGDDERDRETQRVRTGDDEHGDDALDDRRVELDGERPRDGGDGRGADGDVEQPPCRAVGERLGPRLALLGFLHEAHDARQRAVVADRGDADAEAPVAVDGAPTTSSPGAFDTGFDSPVIIASVTSDSPPRRRRPPARSRLAGRARGRRRPGRRRPPPRSPRR